MIAVVCPSNRPDRLAIWRKAWAWEAVPDVRLYVVEDTPETWAAIDADLGPHAWIIPRQTDGIRCWGFMQASRDGAEWVLTLDDDCLPVESAEDFVSDHVMSLAHGATTWERSAWNQDGLRGMGRVEGKPLAANLGLWVGVPDVDAETQLAHVGSWDFRPSLEDERLLPPGTFCPLSAMNLGINPKYLPALWFGLQGRGPGGEPWGVDRYGDIWSGVVLKKIADHLGDPVGVGWPLVAHDRASDPLVNREKEVVGKRLHHEFWKAIAGVPLSQTTVRGCAHEIAARAFLPETDYWERWRAGLHLWADLC